MYFQRLYLHIFIFFTLNVGGKVKDSIKKRDMNASNWTIFSYFDKGELNEEIGFFPANRIRLEAPEELGKEWLHS